MLAAFYERLREQATRTVPAAMSMGRQMFCQRGLAGWLADVCSVTAPAHAVSVATTTLTPDLHHEATDALTFVIASIVHHLIAKGAHA